MKLITYTVKGIESIAEQEIRETIPDSTQLVTNTKRILFNSDDMSKVTQLRTVDDAGLLIGMGEVRSISEVITILDETNLEIIKKIVASFRPVNDTYSITISAAKSIINSLELQYALTQSIDNKYNWHLTEKEHKNFDIRIFLDANDLLISVRLTPEPLFHRSYRTTSTTGGLRPSVAAAMVRMATQGHTGVVVDNFCGGGTILIESHLAKNQIFGGDISPEAVENTRKNLEAIGLSAEHQVKSLDATHSPWKDSHFDFAISNLPWNKQIKISSLTELYQGTLAEYARILKPEGQICLLVSNPELLAKHTKKYFLKKQIKVLEIGLLGQTPSLVHIG